MRYIITKDYDGLDMFYLVRTGDSTEGFEPYESFYQFKTIDELISILLSNTNDRIIKNIRFNSKTGKSRDDAQIFVDLYTKKTEHNTMYDSEETIVIDVPSDVWRGIENFWSIRWADLDFFCKKDQINRDINEAKKEVRYNNKVQDLIKSSLIHLYEGGQIDLQGLLSSEEFSQMLLSDPAYYKTMIDIDNEPLARKYNDITAASIISLYISVIAGSCMIENKSDIAKAALGIAAIIPIILNGIVLVKKKIEVNKLFQEALDHDNKVNSGRMRKINQPK